MRCKRYKYKLFTINKIEFESINKNIGCFAYDKSIDLVLKLQMFEKILLKQKVEANVMDVASSKNQAKI